MAKPGPITTRQMEKPLATTKVQEKEKLKGRIDPVLLISNRHTSKKYVCLF
jgi:hypothetical protein